MKPMFFALAVLLVGLAQPVCADTGNFGVLGGLGGIVTGLEDKLGSQFNAAASKFNFLLISAAATARADGSVKLNLDGLESKG